MRNMMGDPAVRSPGRSFSSTLPFHLFGERPKAKRAAASGDDGDGALGGLDSYSGEGPTARVLD